MFGNRNKNTTPTPAGLSVDFQVKRVPHYTDKPEKTFDSRLAAIAARKTKTEWLPTATRSK